jgi:hypothetical protein
VKADLMNTASKHAQSAFFVLNVREEHLPCGHVEWRGEILHVDSNTTLRFEDWPDLVGIIANSLRTQRPIEPSSEEKNQCPEETIQPSSAL